MTQKVRDSCNSSFRIQGFATSLQRFQPFRPDNLLARRPALFYKRLVGSTRHKVMTTSNRFTRRQFLKSTAAVAVAAPTLLPSAVWAAPKRPNERMTLGFI